MPKLHPLSPNISDANMEAALTAVSSMSPEERAATVQRVKDTVNRMLGYLDPASADLSDDELRQMEAEALAQEEAAKEFSAAKISSDPDPAIKPADVDPEIVSSDPVGDPAPTVTDPPAPDKPADSVAETSEASAVAAAAETAQTPSQLDTISEGGKEGPPDRLEWNSLLARVTTVESWIKRYGPKIVSETQAAFQ